MGQNTGLNTAELTEYRRGLLARMGVADARRRQARISGDRIAIAEAENAFRALQSENVDILRATAPPPPTPEDVEGSRARLRAQFPGAIRGVQGQIQDEMTGVSRGIMGAASSPYAKNVVPGMLRRFGELGNELAGSQAREAAGLQFAPYTPRTTDPSILARVGEGQQTRLAEKAARDRIETLARQSQIDAARAGAAAIGTEASEAERRRLLGIATAGTRTATELAQAQTGEVAAQQALANAALPPAKTVEDIQRQVTENELRKKLAEQQGLDVAPTADAAREQGRLLADTFGELAGKFINGGQDAESLRAAEDAVSQLEGLAKTDQARAASLAEQYAASIAQTLPQGASGIYDPDSIGYDPLGVVRTIETIFGNRPLLPSSVKRAATNKRRLSDLYQRIQRLRPKAQA